MHQATPFFFVSAFLLGGGRREGGYFVFSFEHRVVEPEYIVEASASPSFS